MEKYLQYTNIKAIRAISHEEWGNLILHSKNVEEGDVYIALKGTVSDGHDYIEDAIKRGAKVVLVEDIPNNLIDGVDYYHSKDLRKYLGVLAANYYGNPSSAMKVVGITGTNGKTTIATLLYQLFSALGYKVGLISTIQHRIGALTVESTHTTPDAIQLQYLFSKMKEADCTHVFMEVSSHAVSQDRIAGISFDGAVFTNLSHDHLDYHGNFEAYIQAKKKFFDNLPKNAFAITNVDDKRGLVMVQNCQALKSTYALERSATFKGQVLENAGTGLLMTINQKEVHFLMNGIFNAYNLLAAYAVALSLNQKAEEVLEKLSVLKGAAGRFEMLYAKNTDLRVIIDYAHTPDALLNVLNTIRQMEIKGRVLTVFGCGGDRDKAKRPLMRKVATEHSDIVVITSDNPRTEDPVQIIEDIMEGAKQEEEMKIIKNPDRKEAIRLAIKIAERGDLVLIAGKGHETYQEINKERIHFDDKKTAIEAINLFKK